MKKRGRKDEPPPVWAHAPTPPAAGPTSSMLVTLALVLIAPAFWLLLQDNLTVTGAAVRFLGALAASWLAISVLRAAVRTPVQQEPAVVPPEPAGLLPPAAEGDGAPQRRAEQPADGPGGPV